MKVLNLTLGSLAGDPTTGRGLPGGLALKASRARFRTSTGKEGLRSHPETGGKEQRLRSRLKRNCLLLLEGLLRRRAGQAAPLGRTPAQQPRMPPLEGVSGPTSSRGPQGGVASGRTTNREGAQPRPSVDTPVKALLSKVLPARAIQFFTLPVPPIRKLTEASRLIHQRAERRSKNHNPAAETKTPLQTVSQDKKQKAICPRKGQDRTAEKQPNQVELSSLPEKEFRVMMMKMIQDLRKTVEKMQEMFTKYLEELRANKHE